MKRVIWLTVCAVLVGVSLMRIDLSPAIADGGRGGAAQTSVRIALTGAAIQGIKPGGHADFRTAGTQRQLDVEVEKVNLVAGTVVVVKVNATVVGMIKLAAGRGELELNTKNHATVPAIQKGDVVTVAGPGGAILLSGTF